MSIPAQGNVQVDPALQQAFGGGGGALDPAALIQQKEYELAQVIAGARHAGGAPA